MIYNNKMESYLNHIESNFKVTEAGNNAELCILQGISCSGESYYYLEQNSCNLNSNSNIELAGEMLTQLEWDCNEIYINISEDINCLLETGLQTVKSIENILKTRYSLHSFDICMSLDEGEKFEVLPSVTIRFYTIRNNTLIPHDKSSLEEFDQPILIESVN